jgi:HEAT repeat protein
LETKEQTIEEYEMVNNESDKVKELIKNLQSTDLETRQEAAYDLYRLAEDKIIEIKEAIPELKKTINDDDWAVRKMSILALGELNRQELIPTFIEILRLDTNPEVRAGTAEVLGKMKVEEAEPILIKSLDDSADIVRQVSAWSLGMIGKKATNAVPKLLEIMQQPDDINFIQINSIAIWALGKIGDKIALKPLITALDNATDHEMKFNIACSLAEIEDEKGIGFTELQKMKDNYELNETEIEVFEKILKKYVK